MKEIQALYALKKYRTLKQRYFFLHSGVAHLVKFEAFYLEHQVQGLLFARLFECLILGWFVWFVTS